MTRAGALGFAAVLLAAGCGGSTTVTQRVTVTSTRTVTTAPTTVGTTTSGTSAAACSGGDLDGSFAVVRGSAGAGQISYELTLTNASRSTCFVSGIPSVQLLDASGSPLPTHAAAAQPGQALAAPDPTAARTAFDQAESIVRHDAPVVPIDYGSSWALSRDGLLGAGQNGMSIIRMAGLAWAP